MPINEYIQNNYERILKGSFKTLSNLTYLAATGFGIDAIRNTFNGIITGNNSY